MELQVDEGMTLNLMEAVVKAFPSNPESMWVHIWDADYSAIAKQLRKLPYFGGADFRFAEGNKYGNPTNSNIALVENPTNEMLLEILRDDDKGREAYQAFRDKSDRGQSSEFEQRKYDRSMEKLRVTFDRAEWIYNPEKLLYCYQPENKTWRARHLHSLPLGYPQEVGIEDLVGLNDFDKRLIDKGRSLNIHGGNIKMQPQIPSEVVVSTLGVEVSYGKQEPAYLPALMDALSGTGRLKLDRKI